MKIFIYSTFYINSILGAEVLPISENINEDTAKCGVTESISFKHLEEINKKIKNVHNNSNPTMNYIQIDKVKDSEKEVSVKTFINCLFIFLKYIHIIKPNLQVGLSKNIKRFNKHSKYFKMILNITKETQNSKHLYLDLFLCTKNKEQEILPDDLIFILTNVITGIRELILKIKNIKYSEDSQHKPSVTFEEYVFNEIELINDKDDSNNDLKRLNGFFNKTISGIYLFYQTEYNDSINTSFSSNTVESFKDTALISLECMLKTSLNFLSSLEDESNSIISFEYIKC